MSRVNQIWNFSVWAGAMSFCFFGMTVQAQTQLPDQVDLLAAYCAAVIKKQLQNWQTIPAQASPEEKALQEAFLDQMRRDLLPHQSRLLSYLEPRLPYLESNGILMAIKSGQDDVTLAAKEISLCTDTSPPCVAHGYASNTCAEHCLAGTVASRVGRCRSSNFLPQ